MEDQIREELQALETVNNSTNQEKMEAITTSGVLNDLKSGLTRFKKDDVGYGSIEGKYGLTVNEVKEVFQTPSLKAKKTTTPKRKLEIIDDLAQPQGETAAQAIGNMVDNLLTTGVAFPDTAVTLDTSNLVAAIGRMTEAPQKDVQVEAKPEVSKESKESIFA